MLILPIRTDRPRIRPAYLTIVLMVICTLVQIASRLIGDVPVTVGMQTVEEPRLIVEYGLWGNHPEQLLNWLTHMFIHGDELHLIGNMLFLWIFGSLIEDAIRPWGLAALYVAGGVMAALAHILISTLFGDAVDVPMVGASGAVAAIMGLFMLRFYKTQVEIFYWFYYVRGTFWVQSIWALAFWVGLEVIDGVISAGQGSGVAHWAHVGGFAAGAAAAPFVGGISAAKKEYITDDPETNVEYVRRSEQVMQAERALKADSGNGYLMRKLAQAYRYAGDYEEATQTYQRCVYRFATRNMMDQAGEVYLELIEHNEAAVLPPEVQLKLAQHLESSRITQAVWSYQFLARHHPTRPEGEHSLLRLAAIYSQTLNQPHEAMRCLYEFLMRYPNSKWAPEARQTYDNLMLQWGGTPQ
jgi:rhomboid family protein